MIANCDAVGFDRRPVDRALVVRDVDALRRSGRCRRPSRSDRPFGRWSVRGLGAAEHANERNECAVLIARASDASTRPVAMRVATVATSRSARSLGRANDRGQCSCVVRNLRARLRPRRAAARTGGSRSSGARRRARASTALAIVRRASRGVAVTSETMQLRRPGPSSQTCRSATRTSSIASSCSRTTRLVRRRRHDVEQLAARLPAQARPPTRRSRRRR